MTHRVDEGPYVAGSAGVVAGAADRNAAATIAAELQVEVEHLVRIVDEQDRALAALRDELRQCHLSLGWRLGVRAADVQARMVRLPLLRQLQLAVRRALEIWVDEGVVEIVRKSGRKMGLALRGRTSFLVDPSVKTLRGCDPYQRWIEAPAAQPDAGAMEAALAALRRTPLVSVLTVAPDAAGVTRLLAMLERQVYANWELCAAVPHGPALVAPANGRLRLVNTGDRQGTYADACGAARGEIIVLLDAAGELARQALLAAVARLETGNADIVYGDEDVIGVTGERLRPIFKPAWSPDLFLSMNYLEGFVGLRREVLEPAGGFHPGAGAGQAYDLLLRLSEQTDRIAHIPEVLYHRHPPPPTREAVLARCHAAHEERLAIERALCRRGVGGTADLVFTRWGPRTYRTRFRVQAAPLVSIVIPTRDRLPLLRTAIDSLLARTAYPRYEIVIVDNGSCEPETVRYLESLAAPCRVSRWPDEFNYSAINNFGVAQAHGEQLLFLNNDVEIVQDDWLTALVEHAQRPEIGAVGAKLLYADGRIQHAGVVVGMHGPAVHAFRGWPGQPDPHQPRLADVVRNCSAVTGACMMIPRGVFEQVGGFDPALRVAFNDIDLCLRIGRRGYRVVYTPYSVVTHLESATRGAGDTYPPGDRLLFESRWRDLLAQGDPHYNPNLAAAGVDWALPPAEPHVS